MTRAKDMLVPIFIWKINGRGTSALILNDMHLHRTEAL